MTCARRPCAALPKAPRPIKILPSPHHTTRRNRIAIQLSSNAHAYFRRFSRQRTRDACFMPNPANYSNLIISLKHSNLQIQRKLDAARGVQQMPHNEQKCEDTYVLSTRPFAAHIPFERFSAASTLPALYSCTRPTGFLARTAPMDSLPPSPARYDRACNRC